MHQVIGDYPDYQKITGKTYFFLDVDKAFNPFTWSPPINWKGSVGGHQVSFTQISNSGSGKSCYDRTNFPVDLENGNSIYCRSYQQAYEGNELNIALLGGTIKVDRNINNI